MDREALRADEKALALDGKPFESMMTPSYSSSHASRHSTPPMLGVGDDIFGETTPIPIFL